MVPSGRKRTGHYQLVRTMTQQEFLQDLEAFLNEWRNEEPTVWVHTSGSTGTPKPMLVEKERMRTSAKLTCKFLGLQKGDSALLCMPLQYIAGKMVVVRSEVANLKLIPIAPSGHPLAKLQEIPTFAAMIPMQVYNSIQVEEEKEKLMKIKHLIIGGGSIDPSLAQTLKDFPNHVWSTYGMTETLSHIALRRLNGPEASDWYTPFEHVNIRLSNENTLIIHAPSICPEELITNDIVEINEERKFRILGRKDNTINSGGVKIQIEQVEELLRAQLNIPFQITASPDSKFGEIVVIIYNKVENENLIKEICEKTLPPYWVPKKYISVEEIPMTGTGKPDRATARRIACEK
ncbi:MAG: AMP-binding protein [Bacteroidaceae bacterium]|nr:AMP-binding protein [Bacteroidaceae bacterium]